MLCAKSSRLCLAFIVTVPTALVSLCGCGERTPPTHLESWANLKQIGLALLIYQDEHGSFPPAAGGASEGHPHSWRVLILPIMGEKKLYDQYDFSQPWDSFHNLKLLDRMPDVYRYGNADQSTPGKTAFLAVVGEEAAWAKSGSRSSKDFPDGLKDTVMVLELPERAVPWTKPEDVSFPFPEPQESESKRTGNDEAVNALFGDGIVYSLERRLLSTSLRAAFTRAGADTLDRQLLHRRIRHRVY